jgi:hypothetical protein
VSITRWGEICASWGSAVSQSSLTWNGIEGQDKVKANVTGAGQLLTAPADVNTAFQSATLQVNDEISALYGPPSGEAAVITSIHLSYYDVTGTTAFAVLEAGAPSGRQGCAATTDVDEVNAATTGSTILPYSPGYVVPAGDVICLGSSNLVVTATANGYLIPAADAPSTLQTPVAGS